jgi:hypothetical protein
VDEWTWWRGRLEDAKIEIGIERQFEEEQRNVVSDGCDFAGSKKKAWWTVEKSSGKCGIGLAGRRLVTSKYMSMLSGGVVMTLV